MKKLLIRREKIGLLSFDHDSHLPILLNEIPKDSSVINNYIKNKTIGAPLYLFVNPSFLCNFKCNFCYLRLLKINDNAMMSKKTIDSLVDTCVEKGITHVNILGGEPLHPQVLPTTKQIIKKCRAEDLFVDLTSNGFFIDSSKMDFLNKYDVSVSISLQSLNKKFFKQIVGVDACERVRKNILLVNKYGPFGISTTITKQNISDLENMISFINDLNDCAWVWRYPTVFGNFDKAILFNLSDFFSLYKLNLNKIKKHVYFDAPFAYKYLDKPLPKNELDSLFCGCKAGLTKAEVLPNGDVYSCILFYKRKEHLMGNVADKVNFEKIYINRYKYHCNQKCKYNVFCTGCPGYSLLNDLKADSRCEYAKNS